ncbi:MAG: SDR family oxidoreductase [Bacteroidia bacterium]|nr:SDR family oxidoreductase [Bacteroidia bacterium]
MSNESAYFHGSGYWAVILGGSSGFGLATAQKLASEGMNLFILHRDRRKDLPAFEQHLSAMRQQGVKVMSMNADAIQPEAISAALDVLQAELGSSGKVRLLLHAISKGNLKLMAPLSEEAQKGDHGLQSELIAHISEQWDGEPPLLSRTDFQLTIEAMALSLGDWVQMLFERKCFAADARVIGLTSEGNRKSWRSYAAVSAAKVALESLCRSMALEFAPHGIRCNVVQPGVTDTPSLRMIPGSEMLLQNAAMRNPFGRTTRTEEVANVIYLLSRDEASWINGALIPVDGGEKNQ